MEVDPPTASGSSSNGSSTLKRSNSAPMINILGLAPTHVEPSSSFHPAEVTRLRRFSSSSAALNLQTSAPSVKVPDRVHQIKREESHIPQRETAHEREIQSAMQMSHSWDDFTLEEPMVTDQRRPRSFSESLHIFTSPSLVSSSPSPTRLVKQCFSPSMQMPVKNNSFTSSPSPSPTRKTFMRCLSPIATRPSHLGKRKFEGDSSESYLSPPKRFNLGPSTPDKSTTLAQPLPHSVSLSSSAESSSPEQTVPHGASMSMDHDVNVAMPLRKPQCFGFTPVREPSTEMQTTDSDTSDIVDTLDVSDHARVIPSPSGDSPSSASDFSHIKQTQV